MEVYKIYNEMWEVKTAATASTHDVFWDKHIKNNKSHIFYPEFFVCGPYIIDKASMLVIYDRKKKMYTSFYDNRDKTVNEELLAQYCIQNKERYGRTCKITQHTINFSTPADIQTLGHKLLTTNLIDLL